MSSDYQKNKPRGVKRLEVLGASHKTKKGVEDSKRFRICHQIDYMLAQSSPAYLLIYTITYR